MNVDALARAYGVALTTLEGLLIEKGVLSLGELPEALRRISTLAPPRDRAAAAVLVSWAAMMEPV